MVDKTTDATFDQDVLKATGPVVVDFWAEWCGPCRMIAPALEEISKSLNGKVKIVKLNVDENPNTAAKFGIMSIPTLMLFKDGQLASRQVGAAPKAEARAVDHRCGVIVRLRHSGAERSEEPGIHSRPPVLVLPACGYGFRARRFTATRNDAALNAESAACRSTPWRCRGRRRP